MSNIVISLSMTKRQTNMITCRNMRNFKLSCIRTTTNISRSFQTSFLGPRKDTNRASESYSTFSKVQNIREMVHEGRVLSDKMQRCQGDVEFIYLSGSVLSWTRRRMRDADQFN
mmetsp:Transcript_5670/g.11806  ORF Transcript_5670/g.11806 Transcript_5670/m.11806 type:complete len:114 (-) Transcript_5670:681-1022(-)